MTNKSVKESWEIATLKILLLIYIILCLVIAGLNFGLAPNASDDVANLIRKIWHFYENQFKTFLIVTGSLLTMRITGKRSKMQKQNFIGFISAALIIHIIGPIITSNPDLYFFGMPLPWSTTAVQTMVEQSSFYVRHLPQWGMGGLTASLGFYALITLVVYGGTLFMGRRWQCSTLCLFNGFISETFSPAFPLVKHSAPKRRFLFSILAFLKWFLLFIGSAFVIYWLYVLITGNYSGRLSDMLADIEVYKYLTIELLMAMFFWVIFTGRGYCYYCPLGTTLGFVSKAIGQRIITDKTECINCKKCDSVCPMNININSRALVKESVRDLNCVGCGHCVDACPVGTLEYSTTFLRKIKKG